MNLAAQEYLIPVTEYLEGELQSDIRHEYVAGQVYAMAGAGEKHNRISLNIAFHLRAAARGKECGVFISDMKVWVEQNDAYYYPDVMVTCDPQDAESLHKRLPCLIVEVLSPATEAIDRREKLIAYRTLPSLRYYLLVSQDVRRVELYQRTESGLAGKPHSGCSQNGQWLYQVLDGTGGIDIACDGFQAAFSLNDIYEDVRL